MSFLSSRGCFVSSEWGSASLQEHVNALFPRIQEKKSIVVAKFLIWGFKAHHMLRLGSGALHHNSQHSRKKKKKKKKIHAEEKETIHRERTEGKHFIHTTMPAHFMRV